jgi:hypothetical protein
MNGLWVKKSHWLEIVVWTTIIWSLGTQDANLALYKQTLKIPIWQKELVSKIIIIMQIWWCTRISNFFVHCTNWVVVVLKGMFKNLFGHFKPLVHGLLLWLLCVKGSIMFKNPSFFLLKKIKNKKLFLK